MAKIYKRKFAHGERWYADFTIRGKRYRIKLEAQNKEQAKKMAAEVEYQVLAENYQVLRKVQSITLKELSDRYLEYAKTKKRSWDRDVVSLKNILNMVIENKKLGDYPVESIRVVHIQKYQVLRKKELNERYAAKGIAEEDRNYATCNRELGCLRHILNMGIEWELLSKNPVASKSVRFDKEKSRERTLEDDEFSRLLDACSGHLYQIVTMALNTGMRVGEILGLKWEDIKLDQGKIEVKHTKNDEDRIIPISLFLHQMLESMPRRSGYLFLNRDGGRIGTIKTAWGNALRRADIDDFRFHDLRHTVASRLARAKVPESVIAMILGHKRTTITSRYINPHWDEMVEAVTVLGELCHVYVPYGGKAENADDSKQYNNRKIGEVKTV
jgi:integrase